MRNDEGRTFLSFVRRWAIVMICLVGWLASLIQNSCKDGLQTGVTVPMMTSKRVTDEGGIKLGQTNDVVW